MVFLIGAGVEMLTHIEADSKVYLLTILEKESDLAQLQNANPSTKLLYDYVFYSSHFKEGKKLSLQIEHNFINHCLKAIQIDKPAEILLNCRETSFITEAIQRNIERHAIEVGAKILVIK